MTAAVLPSKLFAPRRARRAVARPALVARFAAGLAGRLTLISAPAGFGKSSLVAEWLETAADRPALAWLSLDADDDDPAAFWAHVLAALAPHLGDAAGPVADLMGAPDPAWRRLTLRLAQAIAERPAPVVLALDDFHLVRAPAILDGLAALIDHLPPQAHVVLITRADPVLPLARLRANGDLAEIRADDLRFDAATAAAYLNDEMALGLAPADVAALAASTEGWIAGLQLAALSMQAMADKGGFIASFDGRHRFVLDYLTEEALASQPPEVQEFLLETAILDRFDDALCRAVTTGGHGQAMLARLEHANLFLIPLDGARCWYRYHHLFADMLRHLLRQRDPERAAALHRRAARHLDAVGRRFEAVRHALAAGDFDWAADAIDATYSHLERGQLGVLRGWLGALPEAVVAARPRLDLLRARVLLTGGGTDRVAAAMARVARALAAMPEPDPGLAGPLKALEAYMARVAGRPSEATRLAEDALAILPPHDAGWRLLAHVARALGYLFACLPARAADAYLDLAEAGRAAGDAYYVVMAMCLHGLLLVTTGRLTEAKRLLDEAFAYAEAHEARNGTSIAFGLAALGELARERGETEAAERLLREGLAYGNEMVDPAVNCAVSLARLHQARGDGEGALAVLEEALAIARKAGLPALLLRLEATLAMWRALQSLERGPAGRAEALRWARGVERREAPGYLTWVFQLEPVAAARVHAACGEPEAAHAWLDHAEAMAARLSQLPLRLSALAMRARLHEAAGDRLAADAALGEALALAGPEGFARVFLDEGAPLHPLLRRLGSPLAPAAAETATGGLVEPLSEREKEVLTLMAEGMSNQAIADRLGIALNTVKKHGASLMGKLGSANRTQAVARARRLAILE